MGFLDNLLTKAGNYCGSMQKEYQDTSSKDMSNISNENLRKKAEAAIKNKNYGAAKAYADEYNSRK